MKGKLSLSDPISWPLLSAVLDVQALQFCGIPESGACYFYSASIRIEAWNGRTKCGNMSLACVA
jgi:hypothetical protein